MNFRNVFIIVEIKYLYFVIFVNMVKCLFIGFDVVMKVMMNLFLVFVIFIVLNGRYGKEEICEEFVREVEGNGVFL